TETADDDPAAVGRGLGPGDEPVASEKTAGISEALSGEPPEEDPARGYPSRLLTRGSVFRRRHRLHGPLVLYGGRIDPGKGCEELIEYFYAYISDRGETHHHLCGV